jgi:2-polyprenyl-3-methyl-5-hydroxy-6-metoxy-1,4-benzoquinol methylase
LYHSRFFDTEIRECKVCGHKWRTGTLDSEATVEEKYRSADYWRQDKQHQGINSINPNQEWEKWITARLNLLDSFGLLNVPNLSNVSVFEFGCSEGMLLHALKSRGFDVLGNDVCAIAEESKTVLGIDILTDPIENLSLTRKFDLIMSYHVMEHLVDPKFVLDRLRKLAKPGGKIFLHIPIDDKEVTNLDHYHFFSPLSMTYLMSLYTKVIKFDIRYYTRANGDVNAVGSILGEVTS